MASIQSIAKTKEQAYQSLAKTTQRLAQQFDVEAPDLNIHKRHPLEYRQAQELARMAAFLESLVAQIEVSAPVKTKKKAG